MSQFSQPPQQTESFSNAGLEALFDFGFSRFLTLNVMKVLYVLGLLVIVLLWLVTVIAGFNRGAGPGVVAFVLASVGAVVQVIFLRVWLELIVVIFRIGENTSKIARHQTGESSAGPASPADTAPPNE